MPDWLPLRRFHDPSVPKLNNLRRAMQRNLRVPPTWWAWAAELPATTPPLPEGPLIVRSGSPTEDTRQTSNAGQLLSLPVLERAGFFEALAQVAGALPKEGNGKPRGIVFVQPLLVAEEAGIAFCDGFYYERTAATGGNAALTAGQARGEVARGTLARGEPWSEWLTTIYAVFGAEAGGDRTLDIEWIRGESGYTLLQVRPALFPLVRNRTLSLANHKEILGDPPSPWIVSVLGEAGPSVLDFFARADPAVSGWDETYAVVLAERAWMNFSFFFRLMDHWGLPRAFITEGVGGEAGGPRDRQAIPRRLLRAVPCLIRLQILSLITIARAGQALDSLDREIEAADGLACLHAAGVHAMETAIHTNFALGSALSGVFRLRKALRIPNAARVVTQAMMEEYGGLASPDDLDRWLDRYGHRGPLESDPARPRFAEMREALSQDIGTRRPVPAAPGRGPNALLRPLFGLDERRELFRDGLMRCWQRLRQRLLAEGTRLAERNELDAPEDIFFLQGSDLAGPGRLREAVRANQARVESARALRLPLTAPQETIEALAASSQPDSDTDSDDRQIFPGIALSRAVVEGRVVKADDLVRLLDDVQQGRITLGPDALLVVPALEPSWAVVFGRVGGVLAEIGGELSHASILLREAGKPALVNCAGLWAGVATGDRLRLDGARGCAERLDAV